jgi:hypothetical protein
MRVTVSLPFRNVKWILLPSVVGNTSTLTATSDWTCAKDVPFTINTNIPK